MQQHIPQALTLSTWILGPVLLALQIFGLGYAWAGLLTPARQEDLPPRRRSLATAAQLAAVGLCLLLLLNLALAQTGLLHPPVAPIAQAVLFLIGCAATRNARARHITFPSARVTLAAAAAFATATAAVMLLPNRAEWVAGGWDPGVYINNGLHIARTGSAHAEPFSPFDQLTESELDLFTHHFDQHREAFPGIPVDPDTRTLQMYFFPLTPTAVATVAQTLGPRGAVRLNLILALLIIPLFCALLLQLTGNPGISALAGLFLLLNPVFLYHLNIPTSECLQLFLLCCIGWFLAHRPRRGAVLIAAAIPLLAAILNRLAFLPFAATIPLILAWLDRSDATWLHKNRRYSALWIAILLGWCVNWAAAPATMIRLLPVVHMLGLAALALFALTLIVHRITSLPAGRNLLQHWGATAEIALGCMLLIFAFSLILPWVPAPLARAAFNLKMLLPYLGPVTAAAAMGGFLLVLFSRDPALQRLRWPVIFLLACGLALVVQRFAANLRPWVTRRSLDNLVPFCAILAAVLVHRLAPPQPWQKRFPRLPTRLPQIGGAVLLIGLGLPKAYRGLQARDYNGLPQAIAEVAANIPATDPPAIILADHFAWGTPLAMIHGQNVLNGERIWQSETLCSQGFDALSRIHATGRPILFFTSTEAGHSVYPTPHGEFTLLYDSGTVVIQQVLHRPEFTDFKSVAKPKRFRLYRWSPPNP